MSGRILSPGFSFLALVFLIQSALVVGETDKKLRRKSRQNLTKFFRDYCDFFIQCPNETDILPCICTTNVTSTSTLTSVTCQGWEINQFKLNDVLRKIRQFNNISQVNKEWIHLDRFEIDDSFLETLDLEPFVYSSIREFSVRNNYMLRQIYGSQNNSQYCDTIDVVSLVLSDNKLTDFGLQDALHHFNATSLKHLLLRRNRIVGSQPRRADAWESNAEFLPSLSRFENLEVLDLRSNPIRSIGGGQFRKHRHLRLLDLGQTRLQEIVAKAFRFDDPSPEFLNDTLHITLDNNMLKSDTFDVGGHTGLEHNKRPVALGLWGNWFLFVSEAVFRPFLEANDLNSMVFEKPAHYLEDLSNFDINLLRRHIPKSLWSRLMGKVDEGDTTGDNKTSLGDKLLDWVESPILSSTSLFPFDCDHWRMKWLKEDAAKFENRVLNVTCGNGTTIFTTDVV